MKDTFTCDICGDKENRENTRVTIVGIKRKRICRKCSKEKSTYEPARGGRS